MAYREKYKALILKYVPYISKYMACIFCFSEHLKTNNLRNPKKSRFPARFFECKLGVSGCLCRF